MRRFLLILLILLTLIFLSCSQIVNVVIPLKNLNKPTGKYPVGTKSFHFKDFNRPDWDNETSSNFRELMVRVWYPANYNSNSKKANYVENISAISEAIHEGFAVPMFLLKNIAKIECNSLEAPEPIKNKFPLILFSHGFGGLKIQNTTQVEELASNGYVVLAMDHTYDAGVTVFPGERLVHFNSTFPDTTNEEYRWEVIRKRLKIRSDDILFILNNLSKQIEHDHSLNEIINMNKIGMFGHSYGGATAFYTAYRSKMIDAVFGLDAWFMPLDSKVISNDLGINFGHVGQIKWGADGSTQKEREHNYFIMDTISKNNSKGSNRFFVENASHSDFTDFSQFTPLTKKYGSGDIDPAQIRSIMNTLLLDFFNHNLKGEKEITPEYYLDKYPELSYDFNN